MAQHSSLSALYMRLALQQTTEIPRIGSLISHTWGSIPTNLTHAIKMAEKKRISHFHQEKVFYELLTIIKEYYRELGIRSHPLFDKFDLITPRSGVFEAGHQPLLFGGGVFLFGKVSLLYYLTKLAAEQHNRFVLPIFFIGTHDSLHNELITTRFPQFNSLSGLFAKLPITKEEALAAPPIFRVKKPSFQWLEQTLAKIETTYQQLMKYSQIQPSNRLLLKERLTTILNLFKATWYQTDTYADWIVRIWNDLLLFRAQLPIALLPVTYPRFNELLLEGYEFLLKEENRVTFVNIFNETTRTIETHGFEPSLPYRDENFVPFYIQCPHCKYHSRMEPKIVVPGHLNAECPTCKSKLEIEYNPIAPDLSDYSKWLLPRAESRTTLFCYLFPETLHVGGGGETAYYTQLYPIFRKLCTTAPIFVKTYRIYYTTPWAEKSAETLRIQDGYNPLPRKELFTLISRLKKTNDSSEIVDLQKNLNDMFEEDYDFFIKEKNKLQQVFEQTTDPKQKKQILKKRDRITLYLSHFHGMFHENHNKPDVSWNWINLAVLTGINDFIPFFLRNYNLHQPVGNSLFLSPGRF